MARRAAPSPPTQHAQLTPDKMRVGINRIERCLAEIEGFDPAGSRSQPDLTAKAGALDASVHSALDQTFGHATVEEQRYSEAASFSAAMQWSFDTPVHKLVPGLLSVKTRSHALLAQAIAFLEGELELALPVAQPSPSAAARPKSSQKVFVVHGHDEAALQTVARFLEKLGLGAIILREEPDAGRTIVEKFEDCADDVGFAVVLLTPDDLGGVATVGATASRARQNVIFELGYFAGKLGRGRTCLMRKGPVEMPSDLYGVIYTDLDPGDGWKIKLVKELKVAKLDLDANRMWG